MASTTRLPVTVVTGFLGAGKTTVLRELLRQSQQRLAVLVNEFGEVGIDGQLLKSCQVCDGDEAGSSPTIVELANGCLCCTVQDDFLPTMEAVLEQADQLDGIVIETSGLALPEPLLQAFQWPEIRHRTRVSGVVTVVDGEALARGEVVADVNLLEQQRADDPSLDHDDSIDELFDEQLEQADLVLISRADRLSNEQRRSAAQQLEKRSHFPGVMSLPISHGQVDPQLLLGLSRQEAAAPEVAPHDEHHHHHHDHHHPELESASLQLNGRWQQAGLESVLAEAIETMGLLRLKGRIPIAGKVLPLQVQAVGRRLDCWFEEDQASSDQLNLVLIGRSPDQASLAAQLASLQA
ncbi:cobalamin biosynthesis protein CobW [Synechococcus sp. MIT S9452]|uniref:cobalamin biosynthesis protein CobW n=1 Tax=Synechococcus sp. MIT S9452 TaxID=3082546 RepID=UPI0039A6D07B